MTTPSPAPPPVKQAAQPGLRTPWLSSLAGLLMPLSIALVGIALLLWWLVSTATGLAAAIRLVNVLVPQQIQATGVSGSLREGVRIERFDIRGADWAVAIEQLAATPRTLVPQRGVIELESLNAKRLAIDWLPTVPTTATPLPPTLALPFKLLLPAVKLDEFSLGERGAQPIVISELTLAAIWDAQSIQIRSASARLDTLAAQIAGQMQSHPPYAIDLRGELGSALAGHPVAAAVTIDGRLEAMRLRAQINATGSPTRGELDAELRPFGVMTLGRLQLELRDWELADWVAGAPRARLTARADLAPREGRGPLTLAGSISASNATPGTLDHQRLPVRSARGDLLWSSEGLTLDIKELAAERGSASGRFEWLADGALSARATVRGIDAAGWWSGLSPTRISGQLAYSLAKGTQHLTGELHDTEGLPLATRFDLTLAADELRIAPSELRLGAGHAKVQGQIQLDGRQQATLSARLQDLDLAKLAPGLATRLSGEFDFDGHLSPAPAGTARLALDNSLVAGRPLSGKASATLQPDRLDASADLRSGAARLSVQGGLGAGRQLEIDLTAPQLRELAPELAGQLATRIQLSGDWRSPRAAIQASAENLRLPGAQSIAKLSLRGHGTLAATAPFDVLLELNGHKSPGGEDSSIATATLAAQGTWAQQRITFNARTAGQQTIQALVNGGWSDHAWRGELSSAEAGQPTPFRLLQATPIVIGSTEQSLGPADFTFAGGRFYAVQLARNANGTRTSGRFEDLRPQSLDPARRELRRAVRSSQRDLLKLRGQWDLAATPSLNGKLVVERAGGDIYAGVAALAPLGLSELGLRLDAQSGRISGDFRVAGSALGHASGRLEAWADTTGVWRLAQDRPLQIDLSANLASLGWIGPLINDNVQIEGRAKGNIEVRGTPAAPSARGAASADGLRLAWVEQGLRLENGAAEIEVEDGVLVLKNLQFTGPPRVKPALESAAAGIPAGPGSVRAFGRLALATFSGSFALKAERLPVLQAPERWIIASGEAGLALYGKRAELSAKLRADGAYVDFNTLERGPSLPDDVVVLRSRGDRPAPIQPPIALTLDATAELGPRFYIRGAGVESRLEGRVEVKGEAGALRALGSVRTADGTFTGYGQRLRIERGIVTFQGALDNPALNVLALRPNLPVSVGVSIAGTAQRPVIRLYSDPSMAETEKLNWLVLGRPADGTGQDRALLAAAAGALFSDQSDAATGAVMRSLGLDEISLRGAQTSGSLLPRETVAGQLRSNSSASQEVVALGKRINDKLYLSFEQAITGSSYAVALSYQLTQALSIVGRAGTTNAIDLVWTVAFD
ncbi:MAG: translocation/assembly module TamB domain-containing protein [Burkholderiaceae bacterium]